MRQQESQNNGFEPVVDGCPLCGRKSNSLVFRVQTTRSFKVLRCGLCQLVFASPRPSQGELEEFYASGYFSNSTKQTGYRSYNEDGEGNMRKMWPQFCRYVGIDHSSPAFILDIGCATGGFLLEAKRGGWQTKGVDLGEDAVRRAREIHGLDVELGDAHSASLQRETFQMITLWHTLEHLIHPTQTLMRARELLAPGGKLFIEVPNWNSVGRLFRRRRWAQLLPPAHLNYFAPASVQFAARQAGFAVLRCTTHHVNGFDVLKSHSRLGSLRGVLNAVEQAVGLAGFGGYLRLLAMKN